MVTNQRTHLPQSPPINLPLDSSNFLARAIGNRFHIRDYNNLLKFSIFVVFLLFGLLAHSEETYLQINGASLHSKSGYNGFNPGIGLEREVSENWNIAAGWFYNSNYRGSAYLYGRYSFLRSGDWDLGVGIGGATGYNKWTVMPMAFPEVCYRYLCLIALPQIEGTNASILAVHARIPL